MEIQVVCDNLRKAREASGFTQTGLAQECGWVGKSGDPSQSSVSQWERGTRDITLSDLLLWAKACRIDPADLFRGAQFETVTDATAVQKSFVNFPPELKAAIADLAKPSNARLRKFFADLYWSVKSLYEKDVGVIETKINEQMLPPPESKSGINI